MNKKSFEISVIKTNAPKQKPDVTKGLPFGKIFTDHMFMMEYASEKGWYNPRIVPYAPLTLDPATNSLHYGQLIFEGMKAYKTPQGKINLFRPFENANRLNKSAERLCMPEIDPEITVSAISELLKLDSDWIPTQPGTSMYVRPFMMATDCNIYLPPSETYLFMIILSPVGHLYNNELTPMKILVENEYVRAAKGGTGFAKCAGNYAGAAKAAISAREKGYHQVLWLDAVHRKYIEEVSAMNVFFVIDNIVVTPYSPDSILDGITRNSAIAIIKDWGIPIEERPIAIEELAAAYDAGKVSEVFCTGTAAVISPIGEIGWKEKQMEFGSGKIGALTQKLYDEMTGIQTGERPDRFGWVYDVG